MAAAFSSAAIVFNKSDSAYSQQLLSAASSLYVQVRCLTCIDGSVWSAVGVCGLTTATCLPRPGGILSKAWSPAALPDSAVSKLTAGPSDRLPWRKLSPLASRLHLTSPLRILQHSMQQHLNSWPVADCTDC